MEVFSFLTNRLSLASDENFGKDPLIGSENFFHLTKACYTNLNAGMGNPWAGQSKVT